MNVLKKGLAIVMMAVMVFTMIPFSFPDAEAGVHPEELLTLQAGQGVRLQCNGSMYNLTNFVFHIWEPTIGTATHYAADGTVKAVIDICTSTDGDAIYSVYGGDYVMCEVYYGEMTVLYNSTYPSKIDYYECEELPFIIKPSVRNIYLPVGETASYYIADVPEGYSATLENNYNHSTGAFASDDPTVASVDSEGTIVANKAGKTAVKMVYRFTKDGTDSIVFNCLCTVNVVGDFGGKEAYENYYPQANERYFNVVVLKDMAEGVRTTGFDIQVGEEHHSTGDSYETMIELPEGYTDGVTVSKEGFVPYTLSNKHLSSYNWVMQHQDNGEPTVQGVYGQAVGDDEWYNLQTQSLSVEEGSQTMYTIDVDVYWGDNNPFGVWLQQGDKTIPVVNGTTGEVDIGNKFNDIEPVYVCLMTGKGVVKKSQILINTYSRREVLNLDFGDSNGLKAVVTNDVDIFKGFPFQMMLSGNIPISYEEDENGLVRGTIGYKVVEPEAFNACYEMTKNGGWNKHSDPIFDEGIIQKKIRDIKQNGGKIPNNIRQFGHQADVTFIGYFEGYKKGNNVVYTDFGVAMTVTVGVEFRQQSFAFSLPFNWAVDFKAELTVALLNINNSAGSINVTIPETTLKVTLGGELAVGIDKVLDVGARMEGELKITFLKDSEAATDTVWHLTVKFIPIMDLMGFEFKSEMFDELVDEQIYPSPDANAVAAVMAEGVSTGYVLSSRQYLSAASPFTEGEKIVSEDGLTVTQVVESNTYTDSHPQFVDFGEKQVLVWVGDDADRTIENRTCLYYAVYDKTEDMWSEPAAVYNDGFADYEPLFTMVNGEAVLIWNKATVLYEEGATLDETAGKTDIFFTTFNPESNSFDIPENLSNNDCYDHAATVTTVNGDITVVWMTDPNNDALGMSDSESIIATTKTADGWTTQILAENLNPGVDMVACEVDGKLTVYYAADTDGDELTVTDFEIFSLQDGVATQMTENDVIDSSPSMIGGQPYWYSEYTLTNGIDVIEHSSASGRYVYVTDETEETEAILFTSDELRNNVYAMVRDDEGWSEAVKITDFENSYVMDYSAAICDGELVVYANTRQVNADSALGDASVVKVSKAIKEAISLDDVGYTEYSLTENGLAQVTMTLSNNGLRPVKFFEVEVLDDNGEEIYYQDFALVLNPGETENVMTYVPVASLTSDTVTLRVKSRDNETVVSNTMPLTFNMSDISVEKVYAQTDVNNQAQVTAVVFNRGLRTIESATLTVVKDDPEGEMLAQENMETLEPGKATYVQFLIPDLAKDTVVYVKAAASETENLLSNNRQLAVVQYFNADVTENHYEYPDDFTAQPMKLDKNYYVASDSGTQSFETTFTPVSDGFYLFSAMEYDVSGYPRLIQTDTVCYDENGVWMAEQDYYTNYSRENGMYCLTRYGVYYLEAETEYTFAVECDEDELARVKLEKAPLPEEMTVNTNAITFDQGDFGRTISVELAPDATYGKARFESSDTNVAVVDDNGFVYPRNPGTAVITVTVDDTNLVQKVSVSVFAASARELMADQSYSGLPSGGYQFVADESGYYTYRFTDGRARVSDNNRVTVDMLLHNTDYGTTNNFGCLYLQAGETIYFDVESATETGLYITEVYAPDYITVDSEPLVVFEGVFEEIGVDTEYNESRFDFTSEIVIDDETVAKITDRTKVGNQSSDGYLYTYDNTITVIGLKAGTTMLTIRDGNGLEYSETLKVKTDMPIALDEVKTISSEVDGGKEMFAFVPQETGMYGINVSEGYESMFVVYNHNFEIMSELQDKDQFELTAGKTYYVGSDLSQCYDEEVSLQIISLSTAQGIRIDTDQTEFYIGEYNSFEEEFLPGNAIREDVIWSSSDTSVMQIDERDGWAKAVGIGKSVITVTAADSGVSDQVEIEVVEPVAMTLDTPYTGTAPYSRTKRYTFTPEQDGKYSFEMNALGDKIYFKLSDGDGYTQASTTSKTIVYNLELNAGETYTIVLEGFYEASDYNLRVSEYVPATSMTLDCGEEIVGRLGDTIQLTALFGPENASKQSVKWNSNTYYASVDSNGLVSLGYVGTVVITATSSEGLTASVTITIKEVPDENIVSFEAQNVTVYEHLDGYYTTNKNGDQWFVYNVNVRNGDDRNRSLYTVTFKDGTKVSGSSYEVERAVGGSMRFSYDQTADQPWQVGGTYTVTVTLKGHTTQYRVTVAKSPVVSLDVEDVVVYENLDGYWYDDTFEYSLDEHVCVTVTLKDGSVFSGTYRDIYQRLGWMLEYHSSQREEPWGVGDHEFTVSLGDMSATGKATVAQTPVSRVEAQNAVRELSAMDSIGYNGYVSGSSDRGAVTSFTVYFKDGTSVSGTPNEIYQQTGYLATFCFHDDISEWVAGDYKATLTFMNVSCEYTVTVTDIVDRIEVVTLPSNIDYFNGEDIDLRDMVLRVYYTDGTYDDIITKNAISFLESMSGDGYYVPKLDVNYRLTHDSQAQEEFTVGFLGKTVDMELTLTDKDVTAITLSYDTQKTILVDVTFSDGTHENMVFERIHGFAGDEGSASGVLIMKTAAVAGTYYHNSQGDVWMEFCNVTSNVLTLDDVPTEEKPELKGDINFDGSLNMRDVMFLFSAVSNGHALTAEQQAAADYDGNGVVNMRDVMRIYRLVSSGQ